MGDAFRASDAQKAEELSELSKWKVEQTREAEKMRGQLEQNASEIDKLQASDAKRAKRVVELEEFIAANRIPQLQQQVKQLQQLCDDLRATDALKAKEITELQQWKNNFEKARDRFRQWKIGE